MLTVKSSVRTKAQLAQCNCIVLEGNATALGHTCCPHTKCRFTAQHRREIGPLSEGMQFWMLTETDC